MLLLALRALFRASGCHELRMSCAAVVGNRLIDALEQASSIVAAAAQWCAQDLSPKAAHPAAVSPMLEGSWLYQEAVSSPKATDQPTPTASNQCALTHAAAGWD